MAATRSPFVLRIRREMVYSALIVVTLFTTAEIVIRLSRWRTESRRGERPYSIRAVSRRGRSIDDSDGQIALASHPHLIYRNLPSQSSATWNINSDGFRGREWLHVKPPDLRRVVVLGGSAGFGMWASHDEAVFTARIEVALESSLAAKGRHVEVRNAAVIGFDSTQELVLLATSVAEWEPDVVVLFDGWNDFYGAAIVRDPELSLVHPRFVEYDRMLEQRMEPFHELLRNSAIYSSLESGIQRLLRHHAEKGEFGEYFDHGAASVPRYQRNLRTMTRLAKTFGAAPILAPQCELFQRTSPPTEEVELRKTYERDGYAALARALYPRYVEAAQTVARDEAVPLVDCSHAFDGTADRAFHDFVHLDDHGNQLLAAYLLPAIEAALAR